MTDRPQNRNLKPFQKGQSGNPSGKAKAFLTAARLRELYHQYGSLTPEELKKASEGAPVIELAIIKQLVKAASGDNASFAGILDRWIGKVKDDTELADSEKDARVKSETAGLERDDLIEILRRTR